MNQRSFGRKTEQADQMHRLSLFEVFNEAEFFSDDPEDPVLSVIVVPSYTRKPKTHSEENSCPSSMEKNNHLPLERQSRCYKDSRVTHETTPWSTG